MTDVEPALLARFEALFEEMSGEEQQEALFLLEKLRPSASRVGFIVKMLGVRNMTIERGHAKFEVPVSRRLINAGGVVHGGALFIMIDYSMGSATLSILQQGQRCTTIEAKISYLAPVKEGHLLHVNTKVVNAGKRIVLLESRITGEGDELVALATGSYYVLR